MRANYPLHICRHPCLCERARIECTWKNTRKGTDDIRFISEAALSDLARSAKLKCNRRLTL